MTIKSFNSEDHLVSDIIMGEYYEFRYMYYTRKEAIAKFKEEYKEKYILQKENEEDCSL